MTIVHGQVCYLQVPTTDLAASARFYAAVLGWATDPDQVGFEAPGVIGQFVTDRAPTPDAGLLAWVAVEDVQEALAAALTHGGRVLEEPSPDGPTRILTAVADPSGNLLGLVSHAGGRRTG
jgi:predicted enzyme related to lactoylglutathione lyase